MKLNNLKRLLAVMISTAAMTIAASASSLCYWVFLEEVKMPESLYKED